MSGERNAQTADELSGMGRPAGHLVVAEPSDHGPATLLLVFDRAVVRDGVRALLTTDDEVSVIGESGGQLDDVMSAVHRLHPDVVLVDQQLDGADGIATAAGLIRRLPDDETPGVVILSGSDRAGDFGRAAQAGVRGFLLEQDDSTHIVSGVKAVAAGEAWLSARAARRLLEHYRTAGAGNSLRADPERLTRRERSVVELIAKGRSNAEIATELVVGEATVKTHVSRILTKLKLRDRTQLAAFAYRNGLTDDELGPSLRPPGPPAQAALSGRRALDY
jgi:DNA-binding NarL/FixJ family response regulator